jgi:hypothetical protein
LVHIPKPHEQHEDKKRCFLEHSNLSKRYKRDSGLHCMELVL